MKPSLTVGKTLPPPIFLRLLESSTLTLTVFSEAIVAYPNTILLIFFPIFLSGKSSCTDYTLSSVCTYMRMRVCIHVGMYLCMCACIVTPQQDFDDFSNF
jgi:hypothetical protein